jgi:hypothetical protein
LAVLVAVVTGAVALHKTVRQTLAVEVAVEIRPGQAVLVSLYSV